MVKSSGSESGGFGQEQGELSEYWSVRAPAGQPDGAGCAYFRAPGLLFWRAPCPAGMQNAAPGGGVRRSV